jgi:hypothetical protein
VRVRGMGIRHQVAVVRCEACGKVVEEPMDGWRALLGVDVDDEDAPEQAHLYCPDCAEREFGPARRDLGRPSE